MANAVARAAQLRQVGADERVTEIRGRGLLLGIALADLPADRVASAALEAGFIVNNVAPDTIRLAPPLVLDDVQASSFVQAWPSILTAAQPEGAHR